MSLGDDGGARRGASRGAGRIALIYAVFGALWILLSDGILAALVKDPRIVTHIAIVKGWAFIAVTGSLVYWLIRRYFRALEESHRLLRQSEARLRALLDAIPDAVWLKDSQGVFLNGNRRFESLYGAKNKELVGKTDYDFVDSKQADFFRQHDRAAIAAGKPITYEELVTFAEDGHQELLETIKTPLFGSDGSLIGVLGIGRDITARKRTEESLRIAHEQLINIIEFLPDPTFVIDKDKKVIAWNHAMEDLSGVPKSQILGQGDYAYGVAFYGKRRPILIDYVDAPPGELDQAYNYVRVVDDKVYAEVFLPDAHGGKGVHLWGVASPLYDRDGARWGAIEVIRDVTERKQVENSLRESEARLREVQEMARLGRWYWDVKTGEVQWSEEVYRIFRLDPKEFTPRIESVLALSPWPEDHERDRELIRRAMESHEKGEYEQRFLLPDQSIGYYHSTFQGHYDEAGNLVAIVGAVMDITERKRAEEEVLRLNAELEQRVSDRTAELAVANNALNEFAYVVSHDLKAPLRAVNQLAHWISEDYASVLDAEGQSKLRLMNGRISRMYNLIDGILQYSRIGRVEEDRKPIDLDVVVREAIEALSPPAHIRVTVEGKLPVVTADQTRMEQVFQNLIGNAIKFMDKPEGLITVGCEDLGDRWRFRVTDNGPGIDSKYHEKVFGIFQTLVPRDQQESTGIGLALVRKIVEGYDGEVELQSEVGQGCTFTFTLPK